MGPSNHVTFTFGVEVSMEEVDGTLRLSLMAAESLHGADRVRLEASMHLDPLHRTCAIATHTPVGRSLAVIFLGYLRREFGEGAVDLVKREDHP